MADKPTPNLEIEIVVKARLLNAQGATSGKVQFCYEGATITENGKEIGSINPTLAASLQVRDRNGNTWDIGPEGVWEGFQKIDWKLPED